MKAEYNQSDFSKAESKIIFLLNISKDMWLRKINILNSYENVNFLLQCVKADRCSISAA